MTKIVIDSERNKDGDCFEIIQIGMDNGLDRYKIVKDLNVTEIKWIPTSGNNNLPPLSQKINILLKSEVGGGEPPTFWYCDLCYYDDEASILPEYWNGDSLYDDSYYTITHWMPLDFLED